MSRNYNHWEKARALAERHFKELLMYVYTLVQDRVQAEDIVSNVFRTINNNEDVCRDIREPAWGYLAKMARNEWLMSLRTKESEERKIAGYSVLHAEEFQQSVEVDYMFKELMANLYQLIDNLPERMQLVIKLGLEDRTTAEIADTMGITKQTVLNMKNKAIAILAKELKKRGLRHLVGWLWLFW